MANSAPGQHYREGMSLIDLFKRFPSDEAAEAWFMQVRWPEGVCCPSCGSVSVQTGAKHKTMPFRCRDCRKRFSLKSGTLMEGSKLGYQTWAIAIYLFNTGIKGTSSMKLHRDLGVTQKTAWHLAHRIRESWDSAQGPFDGPVEVDEAFVGGKSKNKHAAKREKGTQGGQGKSIVVGMKDRATNCVAVDIVPKRTKVTLHSFVASRIRDNTRVYTDEAYCYRTLPYPHSTVRHSAGEYVRGDVWTNGIESFWALFKRGYYGTYHKMSPKHLPRYLAEFTGRHNARRMDTMDLMRQSFERMVGKRLRYMDLTA